MHSAAFLLYLLHSEAVGVECDSTGLKNSFFNATMPSRLKADWIIRLFNRTATLRASSFMPAECAHPSCQRQDWPRGLLAWKGEIQGIHSVTPIKLKQIDSHPDVLDNTFARRQDPIQCVTPVLLQIRTELSVVNRERRLRRGQTG